MSKWPSPHLDAQRISHHEGRGEWPVAGVSALGAVYTGEILR